MRSSSNIMRFKKAPLRTTGMESAAGCSPSSSVSDDADIASHKGDMVLPRLGRGGASTGPLPPSPSLKRDSYVPNTRDEETQAAHAKLRQYEALGHIKVELDEVSTTSPALVTHPVMYYPECFMVHNSAPPFSSSR